MSLNGIRGCANYYIEKNHLKGFFCVAINPSSSIMIHMTIFVFIRNKRMSLNTAIKVRFFWGFDVVIDATLVKTSVPLLILVNET